MKTPSLGTPYRRLSEEQCQKLHEAALEILDRTGARLHYPPAVALLKSAGARVSEKNLVQIPPKLVEQALKTLPEQVTLYNRDGEPVIPLKGRRSFFGTGSDCLNIIDHRTGERRKPVLSDVVDGMTLCDALPNIDFVMCMFLPVDVPIMVADRYQMNAMLTQTSKAIIYVTTDLAGCEDAVEMAEIVVGGTQVLQEKPLAACYINVTNALQHNEEALQKLLYLSGKGLPAAMLMSNLQATLRGQARNCDTPANCLSRSNELLYHSTESDRFATLFYGIIDLAKNYVKYCNAGHDIPILIKNSGEVVEIKESGLMLGAFPEYPFKQDEFSMDKGDMLILYSDGVTEAMNEDEHEFSINNLIPLVVENNGLPPDRLLNTIIDAVKSHSGSTPQSDDITLMIIKRT